MKLYAFTEDDKRRLTRIKEIYARHILGGPEGEAKFETKTIPNGFLRGDKTTSNLTISEMSVTHIFGWLDRAGSGVCDEYVEKMLREIIEYQSKRFEAKRFQRGLGDPTDMLLNEFKEWLLELSQGGFDQTSSEAHLVNVKKRIQFLQALDDKKLFPPGSGATRFTRLDLFAKLKSTLETEVLPLLEAVPGLLSAREEFESLHKRSKKLLKKGIQIAYLIFKNTEKNPRIISVYDAFMGLENAQAASWIQQGLKTKSDHFIKALSLSCGELLERGTPITETQKDFFKVPKGLKKNDYFFKQLTHKNAGIEKYFLDQHKEYQTQWVGSESEWLALITDNQKAKSKRLYLYQREHTVQYALLGAHGEWVQDEILHEPTPLEVSKVLKTEESARIFSKVLDMALYKEQIQQSPLLLLLQFEQLLYDFAKVTALINQGHQIAGMGNNILLYGFLQGNILLLLDLYSTVLFSGLEKTLNTLVRSVAPLKKLEDHDPGFTQWGWNYQSAKSEITSFFRDVNLLKKSVETIRTHVQSLDLRELLSKAERAMNQFSSDLGLVHDHLSANYPSFTLPRKQMTSSFQKKNSPVAKPVLFSDGEADEKSDDDFEKPSQENPFNPLGDHPMKPANQPPKPDDVPLQPMRQYQSDIPSDETNQPFNHVPCYSYAKWKDMHLKPVTDPMSFTLKLHRLLYLALEQGERDIKKYDWKGVNDEAYIKLKKDFNRVLVSLSVLTNGLVGHITATGLLEARRENDHEERHLMDGILTMISQANKNAVWLVGPYSFYNQLEKAHQHYQAIQEITGPYEERLNGQNAEIAELRRQVDQLATERDALSCTNAKLEKIVTTQDSRLEALDHTVATSASTINGLQNSIENTLGTINGLKDVIQDLTKPPAAVTRPVENPTAPQPIPLTRQYNNVTGRNNHQDQKSGEPSTHSKSTPNSQLQFGLDIGF